MGLVAGIIGAAGYAGAELVRILSRHPEFDLRVITSSTDEGLPISELYPAFKGVCDLEFHPTLVACAGCYPTATSLAAWPAVALSEGVVVVDAISGVTGAGRSANARTHFCNANDNFEAYGVASHRHTPEIEQILGIEGRLVFTPHLAPANRGLLSTVTLQLNEEARTTQSLESLHALYVETYDRRRYPFVTVLPLGQMPRTASVVGTNNAQIGIAYQEATGSLIAVCAIDNLCKGAAGQAVQCANIVCGFDQTTGLRMEALPV